jgi:hypothetical protein
MWHTLLNKRFSSCVVVTLVGVTGLASCRRADKAAEGNKAVEEKSAQRTFASPAEAGNALVAAARAEDRTAVLAIFGPAAGDVLFTGDTETDTRKLKDFAAAYDRMHRWGTIKAGGETLYVGTDNYPFPIPLDRDKAGRWYFDTAAGKDEVLARRIGSNELAAMAATGAIADAEQQYFARPRGDGKARQYAQRFVSDPGTQNGLYWPVREGEAPSPLGRLGELAMAAGRSDAGDTPQPFNGYIFRILTKQGKAAEGGARDYIVDGRMTGGFAVIAYPADYQDTGIMTFLIGPEGVVYQRDLGEKTSEVAAATTEYNPGDGWTPVIPGSDEAETRGTSGRRK